MSLLIQAASSSNVRCTRCQKHKHSFKKCRWLVGLKGSKNCCANCLASNHYKDCSLSQTYGQPVQQRASTQRRRDVEHRQEVANQRPYPGLVQRAPGVGDNLRNFDAQGNPILYSTAQNNWTLARYIPGDPSADPTPFWDQELTMNWPVPHGVPPRPYRYTQPGVGLRRFLELEERREEIQMNVLLAQGPRIVDSRRPPHNLQHLRNARPLDRVEIPIRRRADTGLVRSTASLNLGGTQAAQRTASTPQIPPPAAPAAGQQQQQQQQQQQGGVFGGLGRTLSSSNLRNWMPWNRNQPPGGSGSGGARA